MSSKSSSVGDQAAAVSRSGVGGKELRDFMAQGMNMASGGDLLGLSVRKENLKQVGYYADDGIDIFGWNPNKTESFLFEREQDFKTVGQETLDKMMSMFSKRKKEVDQKMVMPGRSQVAKDILA